VPFFLIKNFPLVKTRVSGKFVAQKKLNQDMEQPMRSRFTHTQIHQILKEADLGTDVKEVCRKYGISRNTFYNWKNKYGGMTPSDAKIKHELEIENRRLKKMVAERDLEIEAMKELLSKKW